MSLSVLIVVLLLLSVAVATAEYRRVFSASCVLQSLRDADAPITGSFRFTSIRGIFEYDYEVRGLTNGDHAYHVHSRGDVLGFDGQSSSGHLVGSAPDRGDGVANEIGNLNDGTPITSEGGLASDSRIKDDNLVALDGSSDFIIGRSIVILGNSTSPAARVASCVIGIDLEDRVEAEDNDHSDVKEATCRLVPTAEYGPAGLNGFVRFWQTTPGDNLAYHYFVGGLGRRQVYTIQVHQRGDISSGFGTATAGVFEDKTGTNVIGMLARVSSSVSGQFAGRRWSGNLSLHGENNIVGRSVAVLSASTTVVAQCVVGVSVEASDLAGDAAPLVYEAQAMLAPTSAAEAPLHLSALVELRHVAQAPAAAAAAFEYSSYGGASTTPIPQEMGRRSWRRAGHPAPPPDNASSASAAAAAAPDGLNAARRRLSAEFEAASTVGRPIMAGRRAGNPQRHRF